jgi:hypothetical protein
VLFVVDGGGFVGGVVEQNLDAVGAGLAQAADGIKRQPVG